MNEHEYPSTASLAAGLEAHDVWFRATVERPALPAALAVRTTMHRRGAMRALTVDGLTVDDLPMLADTAPFAFVHRHGGWAESTTWQDPLAALQRAGIALHLPPGGHPAGALAHRRTGSAEFLLASPDRLRQGHAFAPLRLVSSQPGGGVTRQAVAVLDLVQDFEVLKPLLARAAGPESPFAMRLAVSERVAKSAVWPQIEIFTQALGIDWFTPRSASEVVAFLGSARSLLLTASESTAAAHAFGHAVCRIAPPRALRITLQHGMECIGLRHHRAHDFDFPRGVRFASDIILTWDHPSGLSDIHPGEIDKCIPVGVVKAIAERAAVIAERDWSGRQAKRTVAAPRRLLIAENLHSVRFRSPGRYQRFQSFVREAAASSDIELTIRSHPASRILEKQQESNRLRFLDGLLRFEDLRRFDAFVSPPSTILLDSVLAGVPVAVWSDGASVGDCANYRGLPVVADFADWQALNAGPQSADDQLEWAVDSTAALDGAPAAWDAIVRLFD